MKKIMFNDKYGLTRAVIEGLKTQTRRVITPQPKYDEHKGIIWKGFAYGIKGWNAPYDAYDNFISPLKEFNRLPYNIGEEVAVAQSYDDIYMEKNAPCPIPDEYRLNAYDKGFNQGHKGWKNKMFVSSDDMPYRIKITNIRVERLQDISYNDCIAEGIEACGYDYEGREIYSFRYGDKWYEGYRTEKEAYASLIDKVSGRGTWDSNPWVFVYDFDLIKKRLYQKRKR